MTLFDPNKKFVRVTRLREDGFIEFDFSVGEAEIYVEMILPAKAFDDFCLLNKVTFLDESTSLHIEEGDPNQWRLADVNAQIAKSGGSRQP